MHEALATDRVHTVPLKSSTHCCLTVSLRARTPSRCSGSSCGWARFRRRRRRGVRTTRPAFGCAPPARAAPQLPQGGLRGQGREGEGVVWAARLLWAAGSWDGGGAGQCWSGTHRGVPTSPRRSGHGDPWGGCCVARGRVASTSPRCRSPAPACGPVHRAGRLGGLVSRCERSCRAAVHRTSQIQLADLTHLTPAGWQDRPSNFTRVK